MSFLTHGPNQRAYESQSSVWSGPMKQGVKRAGRWLNSQAPQPPPHGESAVWSRLPVLEAVELHRVLTTPPINPLTNTVPSSYQLRMPVLEALELHRFTMTSDAAALYPGVSWFRWPQIPNEAVSSDIPIELRKFAVGSPPAATIKETTTPLWNVQRKGTKRAGRWITSQPYQPRIVPESRYDAFDIVNLLSGALPEQLRKFVQGQPSQSHATEAVQMWGIKIPNPPAAGTNEELRRFWTTVDAQASFRESSAMYRPQVPMDKDLYAVRRMFASIVAYYDRFKMGSETLRRVEIPAAFPPLPIELQVFAFNADAQPTQRATSSLWIPQLQALTVLPEELKRWIYGDDPLVLRQVLSWTEGPQIPNLAPPLPIELQQFVVGNDAIPLQRGVSGLLSRYMPDTFPLPIELQQFLLTDPRQKPFESQSSITTRKINELVAMPIELRHYVETAFQRYRSHYLILRGTFIAAPVPDVLVEYKYFRGYTIIKKKTRLQS